MANSKKVVRDGYNKIASRYAAVRDPESEDIQLLNQLVSRLSKGAVVLDAGCGSGYPATRVLAQSFEVVGVDFSNEQIRLAMINITDSAFVCADIARMPFKKDVFDAVCSYYAIIHLPRQEHPKLLIDCHRILKTGGLALLCMGAGDLPEDNADYLGAEMFWSHYDRETNLRMMEESGFSVLWQKVVEDPIDPGSSHLFVLGQKKQ